jgi:hypothetical protein
MNNMCSQEIKEDEEDGALNTGGKGRGGSTGDGAIAVWRGVSKGVEGGRRSPAMQVCHP